MTPEFQPITSLGSESSMKEGKISKTIEQPSDAEAPLEFEEELITAEEDGDN